MGPVSFPSAGRDLGPTNRGSAEASFSSFSTFSGVGAFTGRRKQRDFELEGHACEAMGSRSHFLQFD